MQQETTPPCEESGALKVKHDQPGVTVIGASPNLAKSPALQRLLDEVRNEESVPYMAHYNRTHKRHNRS